MNDKTLIKVGRYVVSFAPVIYFCAMVGMCFGVQNIISAVVKENSLLSKRLTASDLKRSEVERKLAANSAVSPQAPGIVIISPDGSRVHTFEAPRALSTFQKDVVF